MQIDITTILQYIEHGGALGILVLAVYAFMKGLIVPRWLYDREVQRGDTQWQLIVKSLRVTEAAVTAVSKQDGVA